MALTVFGMVGFLLMGFTVYARHKSVIYIGRILTGFLVGAATPASQIYVIIFMVCGTKIKIKECLKNKK